MDKNQEVYKAYDLAKYIIKKCEKEGMPISNLQLQKILYFIQYNFLATFGKPAFIDKMEAWQYGPVVPDVYNRFTYMGGNVIVEHFDVNPNVLFKDNVEREIVDMITETCRIVNPWKLVDIVHEKGSPWDRVFEKNKKNEITVMDIYNDIQERRENE